MRTRTAIAAAAILAAALAGCSSDDSSNTAKTTPSITESELTPEQRESILADNAIPAEPTGSERQELLDALAKVAPDTVTYEDKAIDAARNQCSAINGGAQRLDWSASVRFTYKDVTTTEAQGKQINQALKDLGFCDV